MIKSQNLYEIPKSRTKLWQVSDPSEKDVYDNKTFSNEITEILFATFLFR